MCALAIFRAKRKWKDFYHKIVYNKKNSVLLTKLEEMGDLEERKRHSNGSKIFFGQTNTFDETTNFRSPKSNRCFFREENDVKWVRKKG